MTMAFQANPALAGARVTWLGAFRSELTKFRTLRSTFVILSIAAVILLGLWSIIAFGFGEAFRSGDAPSEFGQILDPLAISLRSVWFAQLAIGVLGVTVVTNEYSTGMIRATLAAVPGRTSVLLAKAATVVLMTLVVMIPAVFAAFFIGNMLLGDIPEARDLSDPGIIRALVGAGLYLALVGLMGSIFGWLLRSSAGAIFALVAVLILLPVILPLIPLEWLSNLADYLPTAAGQAVYGVEVNQLAAMAGEMAGLTSRFDAWTGFAIFAAYVVVGFAFAAWVLKRRDA